jgi:hypothetical protein
MRPRFITKIRSARLTGDLDTGSPAPTVKLTRSTAADAEACADAWMTVCRSLQYAPGARARISAHSGQRIQAPGRRQATHFSVGCRAPRSAWTQPRPRHPACGCPQANRFRSEGRIRNFQYHAVHVFIDEEIATAGIQAYQRWNALPVVVADQHHAPGPIALCALPADPRPAPSRAEPMLRTEEASRTVRSLERIGRRHLTGRWYSHVSRTSTLTPFRRAR